MFWQGQNPHSSIRSMSHVLIEVRARKSLFKKLFQFQEFIYEGQK